MSRSDAQIEAYQTYKRLTVINEIEILPTFENLLVKTPYYDCIEFSQKFFITKDLLLVNPMRFSLWKYNYSPEKDAAFTRTAADCFKQISMRFGQQNVIAEIVTPSEPLSSSLEWHLVYGVEIGLQVEKTRLKSYQIYPYSGEFRSKIQRRELDSVGKVTHAEYVEWPIESIEAGNILSGLPGSFSNRNYFSAIYVESTRLHFEVTHAGRMLLVSILTDVLAAPQVFHQLIHHLIELTDVGFLPVIVSMHRDELISRNPKQITVYYRYNSTRDV